MNEEFALSYKDVVKEYVSSHLGRETRSRGVEGLSLDIRRGEVFGLLGLNGSGKTTTMKLALGLIQITGGEVSVFGHRPGSIEALSRIGYLPELPYFYPYLTAKESLEFYGKLSGLSGGILSERVPKVLEKVGLGPSSHREAREFSKGMLQRLGLAQAIVHEPQLVVLDEPVSGLDPLAVHDFRVLMKELNEEGQTLLLSSHSISNVESLCDRVGILVEGKLVKLVEQAEWKDQPGFLEKIFVATVRPEVKR